MLTKAGFRIVRFAEIPWEDRKNVDGWPSRAGMYYDDRDHQLCMRLIDYPVGSTEPRHVHAGSHATTVLKGRAIIDGLTLGPLDVVLGPSNEPHGPLHYPDGCKLFSVFHGSYYHSEVAELSGKEEYRLVESGKLSWQSNAGDGQQTKTLIDHGVGRVLLQVQHFAPRSRLLPNPQMLAALVVDGQVRIEEEALGTWDFYYVLPGANHGAVHFPEGATLLTVALL